MGRLPDAFKYSARARWPASMNPVRTRMNRCSLTRITTGLLFGLFGRSKLPSPCLIGAQFFFLTSTQFITVADDNYCSYLILFGVWSSAADRLRSSIVVFRSIWLAMCFWCEEAALAASFTCRLRFHVQTNINISLTNNVFNMSTLAAIRISGFIYFVLFSVFAGYLKLRARRSIRIDYALTTTCIGTHVAMKASLNHIPSTFDRIQN